MTTTDFCCNHQQYSTVIDTKGVDMTDDPKVPQQPVPEQPKPEPTPEPKPEQAQ